ncbi:unnamed protein product [Periconia digitata]|uniref:F-box domain-containing protein n=1 Tax=Periconia digitata TaxID=1303443 RepID=A0A9W4U796_9PLEO|nr:unnamed protein product [Periconia digitata]
MLFSSIPPELKLLVAEYLDPESCFNLAISCKQIWFLCRSLVDKHSKLLSENQSLIVPPLQPMFDIINNPPKGWYIRDCVLWYSEFNAAGETPKSLKDKERLISYYTNWMEEEGSKGHTIPYKGQTFITPITQLMHRLPFLTTLSINSQPNKYEPHDTYEHAYINFMHVLSRLYLRSLGTQQVCNLPFKFLTTVAVVQYNVRDGCDFDWCLGFMYIHPVSEELHWQDAR